MKDNKVCTDCLPSRGGSCRNSAPPGQSDSSNTQSAEPEERSLLTEPSSEPHLEQRVTTSNPSQVPDRETITTFSDFNPLEPPSFYWGEVDATTISLRIDKAYQQIVHWKPNFLKLPSGRLFVNSMASLLSAYAEGNALESIAAMCMHALLLQRPHNRSKNADHVNLLKSRLNKWKNGDIDLLLHEGQTIQSHLPPRSIKDKGTKAALSFAHMMEAGSVKTAQRMITECSNTGTLPLHSVQPDS